MRASTRPCQSLAYRPPSVSRGSGVGRRASTSHWCGLPVAPATLAKLASIGGGPAFHKASRTPL